MSSGSTLPSCPPDQLSCRTTGHKEPRILGSRARATDRVWATAVGSPNGLKRQDPAARKTCSIHPREHCFCWDFSFHFYAVSAWYILVLALFLNSGLDTVNWVVLIYTLFKKHARNDINHLYQATPSQCKTAVSLQQNVNTSTAVFWT